jgi:hypothetical protein
MTDVATRPDRDAVRVVEANRRCQEMLSTSNFDALSFISRAEAAANRRPEIHCATSAS